MRIGTLRRRGGLVVCGALVAGLLGRLPAAGAATVTVDSTADEDPTDPNDGDCSLREAIIAANSDMSEDGCIAGSGADTIVVPPGTYTLSIPGTGEDDAADGDLDITEDVTISGSGARSTVIDGHRSVTSERVIEIPTGGDVIAISGVTIRDGQGGLLVEMASSVEVAQSSVVGNEGGAGAGLSILGTAVLHGVTISGNAAIAGEGGGLLVSGDTALRNVTISGNTADLDGGGIYAVAPLTMNNVTITENVADHDITAGGDGGGVKALAEVTVANTIVGDNDDRSGGADDCSGTLTSEGHNLVEHCTLTMGAGDVTGRDPQLRALADNGGPTDTHALKQASPAVDAGDPGAPGSSSGACEATDQRGLPRGGSGCDIGAYELAQCRGIDINVIGTAGPDRLDGTPGSDGILGFGGNDVIDGGGGRDAACAGDGNDTVRGGSAEDELVGEDGNDRLFGGGGEDVLKGGPNNDRLKGQANDDKLRGNGGRDRLDGGGGHDLCRGGGGPERVRRCER